MSPNIGSVIRDIDRTWGHGVTVDLKPGMAWALYADDGPGGASGQSMRTTCPFSILHVWPNEEAMRAEFLDGNIGRNKNARIMYGVVDDWTSGGVFQVRIHGQQESAAKPQGGVRMAKTHERFVSRPAMVLDGEVPSVENIERWRKWVKQKSRPESHATIDAIFNCAQLGADQSRDLTREANKIVATKLRDMARSLSR